MSKDRNWNALLPRLERAVRGCRSVSLGYYRSAKLKVRLKADRSPVTAADEAVEENLRAALRRLAPGDAIIGEELGSGDGVPSSYWTIDPIDGTRGFSRGLPYWGTLLGYVHRGKPLAAVCDYPALDLTLAVSPGIEPYEREGSRKRSFPIAKPRALKDAVILHGGACWWFGTRYEAGFRKLAQACFLERAYGDCYGYVWLFRGHADAVIERGLKIWDIAPLAAIAGALGMAVLDGESQPRLAGEASITAGRRLAKVVAGVLRNA